MSATTSPAMPSCPGTNVDAPIAEHEKAYFRERLRNRLYDLVVREYRRRRENEGLSQVEIAHRLSRSPVQISRWLGAPGNWTLDTVSDLLLAIAHAELQTGVRNIEEPLRRNSSFPDWLGGADEEVGVTPARLVARDVITPARQLSGGEIRPSFLAGPATVKQIETPVAYMKVPS